MNTNSKTKSLVTTAMFAALISIISQMSIPLPTGVPITLQTFTIALSGYILGSMGGSTSVLLWILLGICGLPVFSNLKSGIGNLFGYTGGFLIGFPFLSFLCGLKPGRKGMFHFITGLLGLLPVHILGSLWYSRVASVSLLTSVSAVSLPYLLKDVLSIIGAYIIGKKIKQRIPIAESK